MRDISRLSEKLLASQEGLCPMELIIKVGHEVDEKSSATITHHSLLFQHYVYGR
jgi:hypothetical protein